MPEKAPPSANGLVSSFSEHGKIEVYSGTRAVNNYGISVIGAGSWAKGRIKGKITSYDYKALYSIYTLKDSEAAKYWFVEYSRSTSHDQLVKTFEDSKTVTADYDLEFQIQGNDYGISAVYITYEVIRLELDGVTKDYVVTNPPSAGANLSDGQGYPGGFKPVGPTDSPVRATLEPEVAAERA